jgi:hypothetical protein
MSTIRGTATPTRLYDHRCRQGLACCKGGAVSAKVTSRATALWRPQACGWSNAEGADCTGGAERACNARRHTS